MLIETMTAEEARVLGTLMEKSLATPDYYPMTLNALRTACNQKSSREPVTEYDEETVSRALAGLKRKTLIAFIPYGSQAGQFKYRHFLEDARFNLHKPDLAVLAVLLLRGGQTLNEIKARASSLHPLDSTEAAEEVLRGLAGRPEPLAELLPKRPGWKEPRWRDRLREHGAEAAGAEAGGFEAAAAGAAAPEAASGAETHAAYAAAPAANGPRDEIALLKREVAELKAALAVVQAQVDKLRADLY